MNTRDVLCALSNEHEIAMLPFAKKHKQEKRNEEINKGYLWKPYNKCPDCKRNNECSHCRYQRIKREYASVEDTFLNQFLTEEEIANPTEEDNNV